MTQRRKTPVAVLLSLPLLLAAPAAVRADEAAPPPPAEVKYKPGSGFSLVQADNFTLQMQGRLQARHTYMDYDGDRDITDSSNFTAERIRLGAKGSFFKVWTYDLEADFGKGKAELKKGYIAWSRVPEAKIAMGQMNVKFDRSQYTSSAKQQFVDRSLAAGMFGQEYDIGLDLAGAAFNSKFQYSAGVFNGEKASPGVANKNDGHLYAARVSFNPNGDFGYGESDIKKTDQHLWYIDLAGMWNDDLWNDANTDLKEQDSELTDQTSLAFGFGYRHAGFFISGEYYDKSSEKEDGSADVDGDGWYLGLGYTFIKDKWEIAARYSEVDPDRDLDGDFQSEWVLGLNRYLHGLGHALKIQTDVSWLQEEQLGDDLWDLRVRTQLQTIF